MLIYFYDIKGIAHHKFVPPGTKVTSPLYFGVWGSCCIVFVAFGQKSRGRELAFVALNWLSWSKNRILLVTHATYSPDLASCDFYLFENFIFQWRAYTMLKALKSSFDILWSRIIVSKPKWTILNKTKIDFEEKTIFCY